MTFALRAETQLRHATHALEICNRSTAEFLDDEGQGRDAVPPKNRRVKEVSVNETQSAHWPLLTLARLAHGVSTRRRDR